MIPRDHTHQVDLGEVVGRFRASTVPSTPDETPATGAAAEPSEPVAQTCTLDADPWLPTWEVLEAGALTIDGVTIDVRHVRMEIDDHDHFFEQCVADWQLAPSGLPVELTVEKQSRSPSAIGDVVYDEEVRLELISVEPLR